MLEQLFFERQIALREKLVDLKSNRVLISKIKDSIESNDDYTRVNCLGYGRLRKYSALGLHFEKNIPQRLSGVSLHPFNGEYETQVFQLAGCDFRCWYCYVDTSLLVADHSHSQWFSAEELVDLALNEPTTPSVIDLSGGQPELVPEWCYWVMKEIERRGLAGKITVWSDDNLSCDFFWSKLTKEQRRFVLNFPGHYRTVCIKGFDSKGFTFNTGAPAYCFDRQLYLLQRLLSEGARLDVYLTMLDIARSTIETSNAIDDLLKRLRKIDPHLPSRVIPLKIGSFGNLFERANPKRLKTLGLQEERYNLWRDRLDAHNHN
ncbi:hypothetical protein PSEUDO8BK_60029 [Pseudomonas sp. 8BK]|uniref:4Fe-4S cluster-binding domain-containing protein n=1 Tax=Pseudomonas sp. 8BK TaxID=2653164 RepID=UPI0012EF07FE|nr:4Fe-4S cluster-binding domain-containing protein [Pseudomonas sp. 8BK]VXC20036.1 hypothetical protein PSEUDO8BK_60029 [Pseudomonas sp. 8BK]